MREVEKRCKKGCSATRINPICLRVTDGQGEYEENDKVVNLPQNRLVKGKH